MLKHHKPWIWDLDLPLSNGPLDPNTHYTREQLNLWAYDQLMHDKWVQFIIRERQRLLQKETDDLYYYTYTVLVHLKRSLVKIELTYPSCAVETIAGTLAEAAPVEEGEIIDAAVETAITEHPMPLLEDAVAINLDDSFITLDEDWNMNVFFPVDTNNAYLMHNTSTDSDEVSNNTNNHTSPSPYVLFHNNSPQDQLPSTDHRVSQHLKGNTKRKRSICFKSPQTPSPSPIQRHQNNNNKLHISPIIKHHHTDFINAAFNSPSSSSSKHFKPFSPNHILEGKKFLADSGANGHVLISKKALINLRPYYGTITVANRDEVRPEAKGDLPLSTNGIQIVIEGWKVIPSFHCNIISISLLLENGCTILEWTTEYIRMSLPSQHHIFFYRDSNGLYYLYGKRIKRVQNTLIAASIETPDTDDDTTDDATYQSDNNSESSSDTEYELNLPKTNTLLLILTILLHYPFLNILLVALWLAIL